MQPPAPETTREGSLDAPIRHPIDWRNPDFTDAEKLNAELERVFDLCHGCRRCVNLCNAFPTLFDLVDASPSMEIDGVARDDYQKVVEHCYLCDLCYQTKCPYIPPHPWQIDFPHLMLRAKAAQFKRGKVRAREKLLASTDAVGKLAGIPIVVNAVNAANNSKPLRKLLETTLGVDARAPLPKYHRGTMRTRNTVSTPQNKNENENAPIAGARTRGKVALFATCYANYNAPELGGDLCAVLRHNRIEVTLAEKEVCCGMPKLELGDLEAVARAREINIPPLAKLVDAGCDLLAVVPSCALMFRQELPLLFPQDEAVQKVAAAFFDPFEYLMLRHKEGLLNTDFKTTLGRVAYHVACHQRVQKIGMQTKRCLELIPGTQVTAIERCSGHDGTYGVKKKSYEAARKIVRPVAKRAAASKPDHYGSDCPMAGKFIEHALADGSHAAHPISLLRRAYQI